MKLEIGIDDNWVNDYQDSLASLIKEEIDRAIRAEVSSTIRKAVKSHMVVLQRTIEAEIKKTTPAKLASLLGDLIDVKGLKI